MSVSKEVIEINPTNLGDGTFSFRNGTPQIEFDIPRMPKYLLGKSLRIQGTFDLFLGDGTRADNQNPTDAGTVGKFARIDARTGVSSVLDLVSIGNQNGQNYEIVKHYNRLVATLMPLSQSLSEYVGGGSNITLGASSREQQEGLMNQTNFNFSIPLLCGILQGDALDLEMTRGLHIVLNLAPDNYVIYDNGLNGGNADASADGGAYYQLSNVKLMFDSIVPNPNGQNAMRSNVNGSWDYNSFSSYYNVISSTDHTTTLNLNTSRTLAINMNMVPSSFINNYGRNSQLCSKILKQNPAEGDRETLEGKIDELVFTRSGVRYPLEMVLNNEVPDEFKTPQGELTKTSLNAFKKEWTLDNFLQSPITQLPSKYAGTLLVNELNNPIPVYNLGVSYDHITNNGVNFKNQPFGFRLKSDVETQTPMSVFLFVKHKNTINFSAMGVNVSN